MDDNTNEIFSNELETNVRLNKADWVKETSEINGVLRSVENDYWWFI